MSSGRPEQPSLASHHDDAQSEGPLKTALAPADASGVLVGSDRTHLASKRNEVSNDASTASNLEAADAPPEPALAHGEDILNPEGSHSQARATPAYPQNLSTGSLADSEKTKGEEDASVSQRDNTINSHLSERSVTTQEKEERQASTEDIHQSRTQKKEVAINAAKATEAGQEATAGSEPRQSEEFSGPEESRPEIDNIMGQFKNQSNSESDSVHSPSGSTLPVFHYPPRTSSLEHHQKAQTSTPGAGVARSEAVSPGPAGDPEKFSLSRTSTVSQPPPPEPDPEPDLPFDFHRFLEQLRHRTADPVAKFLRSFLQEFGKKQWMVHEQVKIISDFLSFIGNRMAQCDVWRNVSEAEFDNAKEGMEKLVMNRLYNQTFSPEIPPPEPSKSRRKGANIALGPGRKGQHQEDVERDDVLAQKVRIYGWIKEEHLDIKPFGEKGRKFLLLAQKELAKVKTYRAPRDKVICVLNCCKVLFGYLRNTQSQQSADDFIPLLIYTVLKANPDHLVSNVEYILRFRNQDKLQGEAGYYMSSLMGAVQFIETLDRTSLTISEEEFEKNVEQAVSVIAERDEKEGRRPTSTSHLPFNEKSTPSRPEVTPRHSLEGEQVSPRKTSGRSGTGRGQESANPYESDDSDAVSGLLRSIQKPFSKIGQIFSDDEEPQARSGDKPVLTPAPGSTPRVPPIPSQQNFSPPPAQHHAQATNAPQGVDTQNIQQRLAAEDAAARQASAETAEAHRMQRAEHQTVVETLSGMFPDLDKEIISDVVRMKDGKVGLAVDSCLALSR